MPQTAFQATGHVLGVAHEQIKSLGANSILEFKDPDGISLELCATNP